MLLTKIGALDTVPPSLRYLRADEDKAELIVYVLEKLALKYTIIFFRFKTSWSDQMRLDCSLFQTLHKSCKSKKSVSCP